MSRHHRFGARVAGAWLLAIGLLLTFLVLAAAASQRSMRPASPAGLAVTTVRVSPSLSHVEPGDSFSVEVWIDGAGDLGSFEFRMSYNPQVLQTQSVELGPFLGSTGRTAIPLGPVIDSEAGEVHFGAYSLGAQPGADGSGALALITLQALDLGSSGLNLSGVQVTDTRGATLAVETQDGLVEVGAAPSDTPTPPDPITATPTNTVTPTATGHAWRFWGHVYRGSRGDTSSPLAGATVYLYGSESADSLDVELGSYATRVDGWFGIFYGLEPYTHFHLVEVDPPGHVSTGAIAAPGGVAVGDNHIRFAAPEPGYYTANSFFDDLPADTPTPTPSRTSTPTATPSPTASRTVTPSATSTATITPTDSATPTPTVTSTPSAGPSPTPVLATIVGRVWEDANRDGQQGPGEPGVGEVKVTLYPPSRLQSTEQHVAWTNYDGYYRFDDVALGAHVIQVELSVGYWATTDTRVKVLARLHETTPVDFGFYRPLRIYLPLLVCRGGHPQT